MKKIFEEFGVRIGSVYVVLVRGIVIVLEGVDFVIKDDCFNWG